MHSQMVAVQKYNTVKNRKNRKLLEIKITNIVPKAFCRAI